MIAQMTQSKGIRMSSARSFLRPARNRSNFHILLNTTVTKILVHPNSKTAQGKYIICFKLSYTKPIHSIGVEMIDQFGSTRKIFVKKEIILCGGAINSPQILLLSGIGPSADLKSIGIRPIHDLKGVGRNLHNHVAYFTNFFIDDTDTAPLNWATAMEYLLFRDGLMSGTGLSDVTAKISSSYSTRQDDPDIQFFFGGYLAGCAKTGQVGELNSNKSRSIQMFPAILNPKSRGYLKLASSDPLQHPKIFANYFEQNEDLKVLIEGVKFAIDLSKTSALKSYGMRLDTTPTPGCEKNKFGSDEYWECAIKQNTGPENHQAGSCKMGPISDEMSVVDHELKVHGIRNLRVMDASIMPKVTSGNTHAPVVMIAEKGVYLLKRAWGAPMM